MTQMRSEADSFGAISVAQGRLWGAQTQRALEHFAISTERIAPELIRAVAEVKRACAQVNARLGRLPHDKALAIVAAADEILAGEHAHEFMLAVWQSGSGTQTNMNLNEVLANRGSELLGGSRGEGRRVHPNDDVNLGQSSNDVIPTAMHLAGAVGMMQSLLPALVALHDSLRERQIAFAGIVKIGRTHLQDATPLTLGQEFSGYVAQLSQARSVITASLPCLYPLAIGGTAVGTGLNTPPGFGELVAEVLSQSHAMPFVSAPNKFAALAACDAIVAAHASLKVLAVALHKIANDIRWLASGPRSGIGEIRIPENEPGSSIMPGKVNPTQCEALMMVCCQVMANDVAISLAGGSGNFELNVSRPLIAHAFLQSIRLLADSMRSFEVHCVRGIEADEVRIRELLSRSLMLVTALSPHIGYDRAAEIARRAHLEGITLRDAAIALQVDAEDFDRWVRPDQMVGSSMAGNGAVTLIGGDSTGTSQGHIEMSARGMARYGQHD